MNKLFYILLSLLSIFASSGLNGQSTQNNVISNKKLISAFYLKEEKLIDNPQKNFNELLNIYGSILGLTEEEYGKISQYSAYVFTKIADLYRLTNNPKDGLDHINAAVTIINKCTESGKFVNKNIIW